MASWGFCKTWPVPDAVTLDHQNSWQSTNSPWAQQAASSQGVIVGNGLQRGLLMSLCTVLTDRSLLLLEHSLAKWRCPLGYPQHHQPSLPSLSSLPPQICPFLASLHPSLYPKPSSVSQQKRISQLTHPPPRGTSALSISCNCALRKLGAGKWISYNRVGKSLV